MGANPKPHPTPLRNTYWVVPGKVLAGEHPGGTNREATRERLQRLIEAGVECFIDLTESGELKPYDSDLPFSVEYLRKPIRDHSIPAQRMHMVEILDCIHDAMQSGRCVYIHCRAGIGRTGTVIGCFLADRGIEGEEALSELNRLWQQSERSQSWGSVPETAEQEDFVRNWKARAGTEARPPQPAAAVSASGADPRDLTATGRHRRPPEPPSDAPGYPAAALATKPGHPAAAPANKPGHPGAPASNTAPRPSAVAGAPGSATAATGRHRRPTAALPDSPGQTAAPSASKPSQTAAPSAKKLGRPDAPASNTSPPPSAVADSPGAAASATNTQQPSPIAAASAAPMARNARQPAAPLSNSPVDDDPLADPEALEAVRGLRDRFLGVLLGLAVGDAVAAATQFRRAGTFTPVGDMLGGGPFDLPRGGWSDDTSMALCLADSLLARDGFDARDQMERYRRWQQDGYLTATGQCVGITASTARAIAMSQWRRQAFSGSHDPAQLDPEPLSRVAAPVLFYFANAIQAVEHATESARTTCQVPVVMESCRSLARALHAALSGQPKAAVLESAAVAAASPAGRSSATSSAPSSATSSAPAALAGAVAAFGATGNFRDAILYAANLGGDSDVIAAVTGQLAGAFYGVKAIPTSWHNSLMQKELISAYADKLLAHAMLGLSA